MPSTTPPPGLPTGDALVLHARRLGDAWIDLEQQIPHVVAALAADGHSWARISALLGGARSAPTLKRKYGAGVVPELHTPHRAGPYPAAADSERLAELRARRADRQAAKS